MKWWQWTCRGTYNWSSGGDQFASSEGGDLDSDLNTQGLRSEKGRKTDKGRQWKTKHDIWGQNFKIKQEITKQWHISTQETTNEDEMEFCAFIKMALWKEINYCKYIIAPRFQIVWELYFSTTPCIQHLLFLLSFLLCLCLLKRRQRPGRVQLHHREEDRPVQHRQSSVRHKHAFSNYLSFLLPAHKNVPRYANRHKTHRHTAWWTSCEQSWLTVCFFRGLQGAQMWATSEVCRPPTSAWTWTPSPVWMGALYWSVVCLFVCVCVCECVFGCF